MPRDLNASPTLSTNRGRVPPAAMSTSQRSTSAAGFLAGGDKTYFEQQREALIGEIAMVCVQRSPES